MVCEGFAKSGLKVPMLFICDEDHNIEQIRLEVLI